MRRPGRQESLRETGRNSGRQDASNEWFTMEEKRKRGYETQEKRERGYETQGKRERESGHAGLKIG